MTNSSHGDLTIEEIGEITERWFAPVARAGQLLFPTLFVIATLLLAGGILLIVFPTLAIPAPYVSKAFVLMVFLFTIAYLALIAAQHRSSLPGWVGVVLAVVFRAGVFGLWVLAGKLDTAASPITGQLVASAVGISQNLTFPAILDLLIFYAIHFFMRHREKASQQIMYMDVSKTDAEKPGLIPKCWQMSRCRPGVRMTCPNFIERIPCWRRRSGCFCDHNLADYLLKQATAGDTDEVMDVQRLLRQPAVSAMRERMRSTRKKRKRREQMKLCHECPLYIEHQEYKYRHLSWISFPITLGIVAGLWQFYDIGYKALSNGMEDGVKKLVESGVLPAALHEVSAPTLSSSFAFEIIMLAVLALLLLSYVIAFTDVVFLKWKW